MREEEAAAVIAKHVRGMNSRYEVALEHNALFEAAAAKLKSFMDSSGISIRELFDILDESTDIEVTLTAIASSLVSNHASMGLQLTHLEAQAAALHMDPDRSGHVEWKEFRDQLTNYRQIKKEIIHAHAAMLEEKEEERLEEEKRRKKAARARKNKRIKAELAEKTQAMLEKTKEKKRQYDEQEKAKADKRREEEKKATELRDKLNKRYRGKAARRIKHFQKVRDTRVLKSLEELSRRNRGQVGAPEEVARESTSVASTTSAKTSERPSPTSASVTQGEIPSLSGKPSEISREENFTIIRTRWSSWLLPDGNASMLKRDSRLGKDIVIPALCITTYRTKVRYKAKILCRPHVYKIVVVTQALQT